MTSTLGPTPSFRKLSSLVAAVMITMTVFLVVSQPASAYQQYCCVEVQAGAAARSHQWGGNNFVGWVTPDQYLGKARTTQRSYVSCYADGAWATGNYGSNRWFRVYVHLSNGRLGNYFVHSSYVYNQVRVPRC